MLINKKASEISENVWFQRAPEKLQSQWDDWASVLRGYTCYRYITLLTMCVYIGNSCTVLSRL
jgi:hypothetical protein